MDRYILHVCRDNIDEVQLEWNEEASHLLSYSNQVIYLPRINKRQLHRATYLNINTPASSAEEYLKKVISIPLLDHLIKDMKERINKEILYIYIYINI